MSSIPPPQALNGRPALPPMVVFGGSGRLGRILRQSWPAQVQAQAPVRWPRRAECDLEAGPAAIAPHLAGAEVVLNLAGPTAGAAEFGAHGRIAAHLCAAAAAAGIPVLLASSAAVYGRAPGPLREEAARPEDPATPTDPANPKDLSPYGRAKWEMEARAQASGARTCCLRIGNVAGADAILGGWRPGFTLDRFADGRSPRRSYIGPLTLAAVLAQLLGQAARLPPRLNIAAPGVVEMGALLAAAELAYATRPAPPEAIAEVALDVTALGAFTPLRAADATALVAEWRVMREN